MDEITKYDAALALIDGRGLEAFGGEPIAAALLDAARAKAEKQVLGDGPRWLAAAATLERLGADARVEGAPAASDDEISVKERRAPRLGPAATAVEQDPEARARAAVVKARLLELSPWRKGPFEVLGVTVDAEWRCDKKWARVMNAVNVAGKTVLDVGCGNGYYLLRALGAGARVALGIDPTWLYVAQFGALRRVENPLGVAAPPLPAWVLPLGLEDLPAAPLPAADVVFSMGVLYHRKSPLEHLEALREVVRPGGTLVLETLVVPGDERTVLVPRDRYAAMRNVWMLPSVEAAAAWLRRTGYADVRVADVTATSTEEQRATEFMASASLAQFLDPADPGLTVEGYPAPTRAILVARRP